MRFQRNSTHSVRSICATLGAHLQAAKTGPEHQLWSDRLMTHYLGQFQPQVLLLRHWYILGSKKQLQTGIATVTCITSLISERSKRSSTGLARAGFSIRQVPTHLGIEVSSSSSEAHFNVQCQAPSHNHMHSGTWQISGSLPGRRNAVFRKLLDVGVRAISALLSQLQTWTVQSVCMMDSTKACSTVDNVFRECQRTQAVFSPEYLELGQHVP